MSLTFAIGDIHGCLNELNAMLNRIEISSPDGGTVIFLGDYVDRGPDSKGVIDRIMAGPTKKGWAWIALMGNHEEMMIGAVAGRYDPEWWIGNGGGETLQSYGSEPTKSHIDWLNSLPLVHEDKNRIFVHAGVDEATPLNQQTEDALLWSRKPPHYSGEYWGKHLVHGHTPSSKAHTVGNRTNVDSGCVFGGYLSCAVFDDDTAGGPIHFFEVKA